MQQHDFADVLGANRRYASGYPWSGLAPTAARGLAVLTCIDTRIEPLAMLGLRPGDAKIIRNAGARATDDAIRSLVLATCLLGVDRIMVVAHTDCALAGIDDAEVCTRVAARYPQLDVAGMAFAAMPDQAAALASDLERIRSCPQLPAEVVVGGFTFDVDTGLLHAHT
jgi:carbonic anhydrase